MSKLYDKYSNIIKSDKIEEGEIISLRMVLNNYKKTSLTDDERYTLIDIFDDDDVELKLSDEQTKKGINFLNNLKRTPLGKVRKNNPFNSYQEGILDNFSHFTLAGFYDSGSFTMLQYTDYHQYLPIYKVYSNNTIHNFSYCYINGKIRILKY